MFRISRGYCIKLKKYLADNKWFALNYQIKSKPIYVNVVLLNLVFLEKVLRLCLLFIVILATHCVQYLSNGFFSRSHY